MHPRCAETSRCSDLPHSSLFWQISRCIYPFSRQPLSLIARAGFSRSPSLQNPPIESSSSSSVLDFFYRNVCFSTEAVERNPSSPPTISSQFPQFKSLSSSQAVQGAKIQGASRIIGIAKNPLKRGKGEVFGMTDFINPDEGSGKSISQLVKDLTGGEGVNYSFECTGVPALVNEALESTKVGRGVAVVIGAGGQQTAEVNTLSLIFRRTLKGSIFGGIKIHSHFPMIIEKCLNKEIQLDHLLTHEITFDEMDTALELLKRPDCVKILIKM